MCDKSRIINWLKDNHPELSWHRIGGDKPPIDIDSLFINRQEGYEIADLMYEFFNSCYIEYNDSNFMKVYNAIQSYRKGEKVKREELLKFLRRKFNC